jgi:hypothetical protein
MRRRLKVAGAAALLLIPVTAASCSYTGPVQTSVSTKVAAADSMLVSKYAGAWWSGLFGGKSHTALLGSLQSTIGMDVGAIRTGAEKTAALSQLAAAQTTVAALVNDHVLSQADANQVLGAITDLQNAVNKLKVTG